MDSERNVRDIVDLVELGKNAKRTSFINDPIVFAFTTAIVVAIGLMMLNLNGFIILAIALIFGGGVYVSLDITDNGYTKLGVYLIGFFEKYKNRRSDTVQALNYYNFDYKERQKEYRLWQKLVLILPFGFRIKNKATVHVAKLLGIFGAKENLIKIKKRKWVAMYDVIVDTLPSTLEEELKIEKDIKEILNILHNRKIKSRLFFTKNKLGKDSFERYFLQLKKSKSSNEKIEEIKNAHIKETKSNYFDKVQNTNVKISLAIDVTIPSRFLSDNLGAWNKAKEDLEIIQNELNISKNIKVVKKTNFSLKIFLSELINPLNAIDPRKMIIEEKIQKTKKDTEVAECIEVDENLTFKEKIKKSYLEIKKKIGVHVLSVGSLRDLNEDVLFYLPESIRYDEVKEEIQTENYVQTNMVIPTNNRLLSDEIVRFLLRYKEVTNVVFNLEAVGKAEVIKGLEQKEANTQSNFSEKQFKKRLGTREKRIIEGVVDYVDFISRNNDVEMFQILITFGVATKKGNLKQIAQTIKEETYSRFGIRPHKALFNQQLLHSCVLFKNVDGLDRYKFIIDSSRIPRLTPISSYTFKDEKGFLLGVNKDTLEPTFFDPDSSKTESKAKFIFAPTGYGKSTLLKMLAMKSAFQGHRNIILDITGEYSARLGNLLDMKVYKIGSDSKDSLRINPFELFTSSKSKEDIKKHIQIILIPVFSILLNDLEFNEGLMDKALHVYYSKKSKKNIKSFVRFLKKYLEEFKGEKQILLERYLTELERYTDYSLSNVFGDQNSFVGLKENQNIIFDFSELDNTKGVGNKKHIASIMHIIISNLWLIAESTKAEKQTFVTIDEAHRLLKSEETAEFLAMLVKEGRREKMSLIIASQDPTDFFNSVSGKKIIDNIPTRFYSGLNHVSSEHMTALTLDTPIFNKIKELNVGEFFLRRKEEKMFLKIELSKTEKALCDTTHSYYKEKI